MKRVCPNPNAWNLAYKRLSEAAQSRPDLPPPPVPLILNGWTYSNDEQKKSRWAETLHWAESANCSFIILAIPDSEFYFTDEISTHEIGPNGGPMYQSWDFDAKTKPDEETLAKALQTVITHWPIIAGEFSSYTLPIKFSGAKARRLLVAVKSTTLPPWGDWNCLSPTEEKRRTFTKFRKILNTTIFPLKVDHIDFIQQSSVTG